MGMAQLDAFVRWCKHGAQCTHALPGTDKDNEKHSLDVDDEVLVNNTVVDNELSGNDVNVFPSLKKMWHGMTSGQFRPSGWLVAGQAKLCTVRWCGAFLCGMSDSWSVAKYNSMGDIESLRGTEMLASFFSSKLYDFHRALQAVTWNTAGVGGNPKLLSIAGLGELFKTDLREAMSTAYGTSIRGYYLLNTSTVDVYSFEFDSLVSSYPLSEEGSSGGNRQNAAVGLVHSVLLAKHLGVEKLRAIRLYYERYRLPTNKILRDAVELLLKQLNTHLPDASLILDMLDSALWQIPIFPYQMQLVALWEEATNWRVLQASAHHDIEESLCSRGFEGLMLHRTTTRLYQVQPRPECIFDYCAKFAQHFDDEVLEGPGSLGVVMETVRTFLAEWLVAGPRDEPDWKPVIPKECFELGMSDNVSNERYSLLNGLIWACQHALQKEVAKSLNSNHNLPSNHALIMLFFLGFPKF